MTHAKQIVPTSTIADAMIELAHTIQCDDGIANAACAEAAERLRLLQEAVNLAYGHLWEEHDPSKRSRAARKALLEVMAQEDQKHGIERARDENINRNHQR